LIKRPYIVVSDQVLLPSLHPCVIIIRPENLKILNEIRGRYNNEVCIFARDIKAQEDLKGTLGCIGTLSKVNKLSSEKIELFIKGSSPVECLTDAKKTTGITFFTLRPWCSDEPEPIAQSDREELYKTLKQTFAGDSIEKFLLCLNSLQSYGKITKALAPFLSNPFIIKSLQEALSKQQNKRLLLNYEIFKRLELLERMPEYDRFLTALSILKFNDSNFPQE
jgi:ATP-dependent Lon protease